MNAVVNECLMRSGFEYLDELELQPQALLVSGSGHSTILWTVGRLIHNPHSGNQLSGIQLSDKRANPIELFALVWLLLQLACRTTLVRAKAYLRIR